MKTLTAVPGRLLIAFALAASTAAYADTYQYDERGALETLTTPRGVPTYQYDEVQRLKTVSLAGQLRASYRCDHKHRRTRKVTTAAAPKGVQTIRYHCDNRDRLMAETTGTGVPLRSYIFADDTLIGIAVDFHVKLTQGSDLKPTHRSMRALLSLPKNAEG
jgi:hypothetical protein